MRLTFFVALLAILQQQTIPSANAPPAQSKDGTVTVTVLDSVTHNPISGARITFIFIKTPPPNAVSYVNSDANGQAVFKDLSEGRYGIAAEHDGYVSNAVAAITGPGVEIKGEKAKADFTVTLVRGATVTGRVLDPNGLPVTKATVSLVKMTFRNGMPSLSFLGLGPATSSTDDRGEYRITGLASGSYYLRVELQLINCRQCASWDSLPRIAYFPGVTDSSLGVPVAISAGQEFTALDVKLPTVNTYTISGTVLNPIEGGLVFGGEQSRTVSSYYLGSAVPNTLEEPVLIAARYAKTDNPNETHFEIPSVIPGIYYLYPIFGTRMDNGYVTNQTLVTVVDRDIDDLKIVLKQNSTVTGKFVVEGDSASFNWNMIRIGLRARDRLPTLLGGAVSASTTISDPQTGDFSIANVTAGRFAVTVTGLPGDAYVSDIQQAGRSVFTENLVSSLTNEPLEIHVRTNGGSLQGTVRSANGDPLARSAVTLVPSQSLRKNPQLYKRVTTDMNGQFTIHAVAPGEYKLFSWPSVPAGQAEENAQFIAQFESRGAMVNITGIATSPVSLTVLPQP